VSNAATATADRTPLRVVPASTFRDQQIAGRSRIGSAWTASLISACNGRILRDLFPTVAGCPDAPHRAAGRKTKKKKKRKFMASMATPEMPVPQRAKVIAPCPSSVTSHGSGRWRTCSRDESCLHSAIAVRLSNCWLRRTASHIEVRARRDNATQHPEGLRLEHQFAIARVIRFEKNTRSDYFFAWQFRSRPVGFSSQAGRVADYQDI